MKRAIGIVRQSKSTEEALSPAEQRQRIADYCEREGYELVDVSEEIDVSGGTPLAERRGLGPAVEAVEAGLADAVLVAYFDRLVRSLEVQAEVVRRVEAAGGQVLAIDFGRITEQTAAQWLSGTMMGAVSEYWRRSVRERAGAAQAEAVAKGIVPWPNLPPGLARGPNRRLVADEDAAAAAEAFRLRAEGATIMEVRAFLARRGISRSFNGVQSMLRSALYVGEIHFGELSNRHAHEPVVERSVWEAVQRMRPVRGPRPASERLLARLGVLRCGTCGARMVVGVKTVPAKGQRYELYRCPPVGDCPRRVTIGAEIAERVAVEHTRSHLAGFTGRASAEQEARDAEAAAQKAQADLDAAIRAFAGVSGEAAAAERIDELAEARDRAVERAEHLGGLRSALTVSVADWDRLTVAARRGLIAAAIERIDVAPADQAKGAARLRVTLKALVE